MTINDDGEWSGFNSWLEAQGYDEEPITDELWIGHPDEWKSEDTPEPPPNWEGRYWET